MTELDKDKLEQLLETEHPQYGILGMVRLIGGERYCFFVKDHIVTMIPFEML